MPRPGWCNRDGTDGADRNCIERVLELGCSSGDTGRQLKQVLDADWYVGIEIHEDAVSQARANLDEVHVANIEETAPGELGLREKTFDLLVALDVLEHFYNPWDVLAEWAQLL